jgi:hypothetical protein
MVRDSWIKVKPARFEDISALFVRDGYLVWRERRADPRTANFRAMSYRHRLYR